MSNRPLTTGEAAEILRMYQDGKKYTEIVQATGRTSATVWRVIKRSGSAQRVYASREEIIRAYQSGERIIDLARRYGVATKTVYNYVSGNPDAKITRRKTTAPERAEMIRLHEAGESCRNIAKITGWSVQTVADTIRIEQYNKPAPVPPPKPRPTVTLGETVTIRERDGEWEGEHINPVTGIVVQVTPYLFALRTRAGYCTSYEIVDLITGRVQIGRSQARGNQFLQVN